MYLKALVIFHSEHRFFGASCQSTIVKHWYFLASAIRGIHDKNITNFFMLIIILLLFDAGLLDLLAPAQRIYSTL